jgi:hypothetical protein
MSTKGKVWRVIFLALTAGAVGMELVAGIIWPGNDRPAWTDLLVDNVPAPVITAGVGLLVSWLPGHFKAAEARRAALQPAPSTQSKHPWRATVRTAFAIVVGGASLLPEVATATHLGTGGTIGQVLAVAALVTRFMARPDVEQWLQVYAPWLAPVPPAPRT